ncbi:hypothetical protein JW921_03870 [Candidatus Fermentibacterales bacterium]|nr:hypothetical protein [Candidatus Fermentibacterales bacterium]
MLSDRCVRSLRVLGAVSGVLLVLLSVLADRVGLSAGHSISRNQVIVLLLGLLLLLAGFLGRRFTRFYRGLGLVLLNLLVMLAVLELLALGVFKMISPRRLPAGIPAERVEAFDAGQGRSIPGRYEPYLVWKAAPGQRGMYATDECGHRLTAGSSDAPDAMVVLLLGGSAAWGAQAPDSSTVAAYLLKELERETGRPVRMLNLGQISWVNTQELLELIFMLRGGCRPELVIFFDGFNDVCMAYYTGLAGVHWEYENIRCTLEGRASYEARRSLPTALFESTNTYLALDAAGLLPERRLSLAAARQLDSSGVSPLAGDIAGVYLSNAGIAQLLAESLEFECFFFLQPTIWTGAKLLTEREQALMELPSAVFERGDAALFTRLLSAAYDSIVSGYDSCLAVHDLRGVFDGETLDVYVDRAGCHVSCRGNRLIAERMAAVILGTGTDAERAADEDAVRVPSVPQ